MVFKNEKELERFLMRKSRLALIKAQEKVYNIIKNFLYQFYGEYHPQEYKRTFQLLESLVQTRIVSDGKGYKAEIYFDVNGLNYETGTWSGEQVFDVAMNYEFPHGAYIKADGKPIWKNAKPELDAKAINILVDMLKAEGIPINK